MRTATPTSEPPILAAVFSNRYHFPGNVAIKLHNATPTTRRRSSSWTACANRPKPLIPLSNNIEYRSICFNFSWKWFSKLVSFYLLMSLVNLVAVASEYQVPSTYACEDISNYYSPLKHLRLKGEALKKKLNSIIAPHHSLSYQEVWHALKVLDAADIDKPEASLAIVEIYSLRIVPKWLSGKPQGWNREHLWPRSYGLTTIPSLTDLHNIRPADVNVNSSRGNKYYGECITSSTKCLRPANKEAASDTEADKRRWAPPFSLNTIVGIGAPPYSMAPLFLLVLFNLITTLHSIEVVSPTLIATLNRSSFPPGFVFGTGSSSYQFEGAAFQGKKGQSIWDNHTHGYPEKIADRSNGDVADDQYHRYKEDVGILKDMNVDAYRFSISWPRILPTGKVSGGVNQEGVDYYNNLINELLSKGMIPFVTLFHWDLPQALQDEYDGFLSPRIVYDFQEYADLCYQKFGDRVKYWTTFNEPYTYTKAGYIKGYFPPRRCSKSVDPTCKAGDSGVEPYIVTHEQLRAHAAAVHLYRNKYQKSQKGVIGITLVSNWYVPASNSSEDKAAALRAVDFMYGWFMAPITIGDYPPSMRALVGNRLPEFTKKDAKLLKGSFDFIGVNYYTSNYAAHASQTNDLPTYLTDSQATLTTEINGVPIGPRAASEWLYVYPRGIQDLLIHTKDVYNNPPVYITENGCSEFNSPTMPLEESLIDTYRIDYYYRHLYHVRLAIQNGVNIKGFFAWSFLDNFEWSSGYTIRFGLVFIDYKDNLKRYPKMSAKWFANFLKKN